jgi:ABC-type nitrate/sulfonate/bicarbonate transport system ATPase subunit
MATGADLTIDIREKHFGGRPLFADLRLHIAPGETVALVGPSGVGKSTLLRLIAGIDRDFTGSIHIDGLPAAQAPAPGFVFQEPRLLPWLTAVANIRAVSPATTPAAAAALLARMGLSDVATALPRELSGGMQRRVALARALAVNSRLLLLDEPFVSLDRKLARDLTDVLSGIIADRNPTLILVSHDPEDAASLADRILRIAGRPARVVLDQPIPQPRADRSPADIRRIAAALQEAATP